MKLFKTKTKKLQERLQALEEHLGVIYTTEDGYAEYYPRTYGELVRLKDRVDNLDEKKGKK